MYSSIQDQAILLKTPSCKRLTSSSRRVFFFLLMLCTSQILFAQTNYEFSNGYWFTGTSFKKGRFFTNNGLLTRKKPSHIDSVINLNGKFIVPAFGEAHHHGIDGEQMLEDKINSFLFDGVFYVKNPNVIPDLLTPKVRNSINKPGSIDVVFSNGGLTGSDGHPVHLHEMLVSRGLFGAMKAEHMDNHAYFTIDNAEELEKKWPLIINGKPDFIKTFLLFSEEFERRKAGKDPQEMKGLDPRVLKLIVDKAHADKLRVAAHVETAADFKNALAAGVDEIAHLPIPRTDFSPDLSAYILSKELAQRAADMKVTVVSTVSTRYREMNGMKLYKDEKEKEILLANQKHNLQMLHQQGVKIAIGSDGISGEQPFATSLQEILFLHKNQFFNNLALLKMWSETTPKSIFPDRNIGYLKQGYEANFLVLDGDPIEDFRNVERITLRVKQGLLVKVLKKQSN